MIFHHLAHLLMLSGGARVLFFTRMPGLFGRIGAARGAQVTSAPRSEGIYQWLSPGRGILVEACTVSGLVTVMAVQDATDADWADTRDVLNLLGTAPLGHPDFLDEFDVWTTITAQPQALAVAC